MKYERPVHHRLARSAENIAFVSESVVKDPNVSIPPQELGLVYGTLWRRPAHATTESSLPFTTS